MPMTLQVLYPINDSSTFDDAYYKSTHIDLVNEHMGAHIQHLVVTKGLAGGPDSPAVDFTQSQQSSLLTRPPWMQR